MDTSEYTVTKTAGPKVAGRVARPGDHITLTEVQARAELLAGAIVPKVDEAADGAGPPAGTFATSDELPHIQARARGLDEAEPAPLPVDDGEREASSTIAPTGALPDPARAAPAAAGRTPPAAPAAVTREKVVGPASEGAVDAGDPLRRSGKASGPTPADAA